MSGALEQAAVRDTTVWSSRAIHDTVASIARQPAYASSERQSLLGRFLRYVLERLLDLERALHRSPNARLAVIAGVGLIVLVIVARIVVAKRVDDARARGGSGRGRGGATRTDYWSLARELDQAGDHAAACHAVYAAVLDALASAGVVRFHTSKTTGDYARELERRGAPIATPFADFARHFERVVFGIGDVGRDDFERLSAAAARVTPMRAAA